MAVGDQVLYHSEHGDYVGWIVDEGDQATIVGFTNRAGEAAGGGDLFRRNARQGTQQGEYSKA